MEPIAQCRICANYYVTTSGVDFVDLFQPVMEEGLQRELEFIQNELRAWQLEISPNDGLPQRICANCFTKFCSIDAFRQECIDTQQKLLQAAFEQQCSVQQQTTADETSAQLQLMQQQSQPAAAPVDKNEIVVGLDNQSNVVADATQAVETSFDTYPIYENNFEPFPHAVVDIIDNTLLEVKAAPTSVSSSNALDFMPIAEAVATPPPLPEVRQDIFFTAPVAAAPMTEVTFAKEADCLLDTHAMEAEMESIVSQDLEDMLQSSIIPTKINSEVMAEIEKAEADEEEPHDMATKHEDYDNFSGSDGNDCDDADAAPPSRLSGNPFACQYCFCRPIGRVDHLIFPNSEQLSQHFFDVHDPNLPYTCPYCPQTYGSGKKRDQHVRLLHMTAMHAEQCEYCKKKLRGSAEMHQYSCPFIGDWHCEECGERFTQTPLHRFRTHQRQHDPSKQFRCKFCDRLFVRRANMEAHERMHALQAATMVSCDECKCAFAGEYELKRHKYQVHDGELPVKCDFCFKGFVSIAFLTRHVQHFHPDKLDSSTTDVDCRKCTNCGTVFSSLHKLRFHLQRPRDENGKCTDTLGNVREKRRQQRQGLYPCAYCSRRFHQKSQQEKHMNTHDARLRPYECDQCSVRCRTACELKQHISVAHLNVKAFECQTCGKCFGYKKDLRDHMLFHAEVNVCCSEEGCDYVCKNDKALNDHIRHKHRLIPCEYCGDTFTRQRLTTHLRNMHRSEIDVEVADDTHLTSLVNDDVGISNSSSSITGHGDRVRVEFINGVNDNNALSLAQMHTAVNTYKPLDHLPDMQMEPFFMGSLIDPDHEIVVGN